MYFGRHSYTFYLHIAPPVGLARRLFAVRIPSTPHLTIICTIPSLFSPFLPRARPGVCKFYASLLPMSRFSGTSGPPHSLSSVHGVKRKRQLSHLPGDSINPLSHSPAILKQFRVAGFPNTEPPPSDTAPDFPHRPWKDVESATVRGNTATLSLPAPASTQRACSGKGNLASSLRECVQVCLGRGDVHRARKAMAVLAHAEGNTAAGDSDTCPWSLRAEFIMSGTDQGPKETRHLEGEDERTQSQGWDPAETMPELREYLSSLISVQTKGISQPVSTPPLDVWWALLSAELYDASAGLSRTGRHGVGEALASESDSGSASASESSDHPSSHPDSRNARRNRRRSVGDKPVQGRETALKAAETAVQHLGRLVHSKPYKTDQDILHLYAAALLFLADLTASPPHASHTESSSARLVSEGLRNQAKRVLGGILRSGGQVDRRLQRILDAYGGG